MGAAVAGLGDVDGDGVPDVAVGVPGKDIGGEDGSANVGLVYLFSGQTGALIRTLNHPDQGGAEAGAAFGSALANAGDVDGDEASDVLIGAPGEGHVFVFSGKTGNLLFDIASPATEDLHSFGAAVAGGKDFNHDGKLDLLLAGNFDGVKPEIGRMSGSYGLYLRGDGKGGFAPISVSKSGFFVTGQVRDIQRIRTRQGERYVVTRNNDRPLVFRLNDAKQR